MLPRRTNWAGCSIKPKAVDLHFAMCLTYQCWILQAHILSLTTRHSTIWAHWLLDASWAFNDVRPLTFAVSLAFTDVSLDFWCELVIQWLEWTNVMGLSIYLSQQFLSEWFNVGIMQGSSEWKQAGICAKSNSLWLQKYCLWVVHWARCSDKACRLQVTHHLVCSSHQSTFCCPRHLQSKDWPFPLLHSLCFPLKPQHMTMMMASQAVHLIWLW